jgi:hypothetical protein
LVPQAVLQLESVLSTAAQACTCCAFCGQTGEAEVESAAVGNTDEAIDPATLLFTTNWRLDFNSKSMQLHRAQVRLDCLTQIHAFIVLT